MPNTIILKKSSVAGKIPAAADLQPGELAVNLTDQKLYSKRSDGTVVQLGGGSAAGGGAILTNTTSVTQSYTFPSGTNGFSVGPVTVASGITVTVASGQRWVVI